ncbi:hypothetical protein G7061_00465 [Erysipelothrix sp. HDW6B]|uniref:hypothetical protein n=1 Tax=Erysipelothrix TaxID=1647 RepID=UPI0013592683|nr:MULTISPECIES: hypothetical protein [Erysipelothrix]QIK85175.1 hypothetical protein G7061_00465 [Erysipelothrix sp. HDW6B]
MNKTEFIQDLGVIVGSKNDIYFIIQYDAKKRLNTLQINVGDEENGAFLDFLAGYRDFHPGIGSRIEFQGNISRLYIPLDFSQIDQENELDQILEAITLELATRRYIQRCGVSGRTDNLAIYRLDNNVEILNAEVYNQRVRDFEENRNSGSERSPLAYIGALGGVLLGMALWVIVGLIGFIVGIIGAVMILAGIKGYQMFGGKKSKQSIIIIAIMSVLGIVLAEYISISISYYQAINGLIPYQYILFDIMPTLIQEPEIIRIMLFDISFGILLSLLSTWSLIKEEIKSVENPTIYYEVYRDVDTSHQF